MALAGAIAVLQLLARKQQRLGVLLISDSEYLVKGVREWAPGWQKRGWKNASKQPVRNKDLWHELIEAASRHQIGWTWVKGHNGHSENERADRLASAAADQAAAG